MQNLTHAFSFSDCGQVAAAEASARAIGKTAGLPFANGLLVQGLRIDEYANSNNPVMLSGDRALLAWFNFCRTPWWVAPNCARNRAAFSTDHRRPHGQFRWRRNQSGESQETKAMARVQRPNFRKPPARRLPRTCWNDIDNTPERPMQNLPMHRAPRRGGSYGRSAALVSSNEAGSTNGGSGISASQSRMSVEGIARRGVQGLMVPAVTTYPCSNFWRANLWASSSVGKLSLCLERRCADALRTFLGTSNETYHALGRSVGTGFSDLLYLWARLSLRTRSRHALSQRELEPRPIRHTKRRGASIDRTQLQAGKADGDIDGD